MGKVGSKSVLQGLKDAGLSHVHHIHRMSLPATDSRKATRREQLGDSIQRLIVQANRHVRFITIVRDPIARSLSAFVQRLAQLNRVDADWFAKPAFARRFVNRYNHDLSIRWFDTELLPSIGVDVFEHSFDVDRGYSIVEYDGGELLILQAELDDDVKSKVVGRFVERTDISITRTNESNAKAFGQTYEALVNNLKLPIDFVDEMLSNRYTTHFYSQEAIERFRTRWSALDLP